MRGRATQLHAQRRRQDRPQEYLADTDPTNNASRLAINGLAITAHTAEFTWTGGSTAWQRLECSPTLLTNTWRVVLTNAPPTPVTNTVVDPDSAAATNAFYRLTAWR